MSDNPITRVRQFAEAHASVHGSADYISRLFAGRGQFDLTVADLIAVTEASAPPPPSGDLHVRVLKAGFWLYDGAQALYGPWGWEERDLAVSALEAAQKAVSHGG